MSSNDPDDPTTVRVVALTTCAVTADGQAVRLNLLAANGSEVAIVLPLACASSLIMTLPAIQTQALRVAHADPSLRIAYPAESWTSRVQDRPREPSAVGPFARASIATYRLTTAAHFVVVLRTPLIEPVQPNMCSGRVAIQVASADHRDLCRDQYGRKWS